MHSSANERLPAPPQFPVVVSPSKAMTMLDCGRTRLYELINAKELESYLDGKARKITVASIYARVRRKLQENRAA
jgi:hypothetical protein